MQEKFPEAKLHLSPALVKLDPSDERIAQALANAVRDTLNRERLEKPRVILVDHGSPRVSVTEVRNFLGGQLARLLAKETREVTVASMEKRGGPEFSFNDPLLADRLRRPPFDSGDVVIALQFLSPGRHAGEAGDIAEICVSARGEREILRTFMTAPIGLDREVIAVLAQRYAEACQSSFLGSIKPTSSA